MRGILARALCALLVSGAATAELQQVEVGGALRIRGRYWNNTYNGTVAGPQVVRIAPDALAGRIIGPWGAASRYTFDRRGGDLALVEQGTRVHVKATFTDAVSTMLELESYDLWGDASRANHITGVDVTPRAADNIFLMQAYVQAEQVLGVPLRLRLGRQTIMLGKGWLVHDIATAIFFQPYDGIRATYATDNYTLDAFYARLVQNARLSPGGNVDFMGAYGTWNPWEPLSLSAYWLLVRDGREIQDSAGNFPRQIIETLFGLEDYRTTYLNTVGLRAWGGTQGWDYDLELAYQFGNADAAGSLFRLGTSPFGVRSARFGAWAGDAELGYTFDSAWRPRLFLGGAYFEGEDNRQHLHPFQRPRASLSFNRLFSGTPYSAIIDIHQDMSNFHQVRAGATVQPTEAIQLGLRGAYFGVNEPFDLPRFRFSRHTLGLPQGAILPIFTEKASRDIGYTTHLWLRYTYSPDLRFTVGWEQLFTGKGLREGSFLHRNGLEFSGGTARDNASYVYFDTEIRF